MTGATRLRRVTDVVQWLVGVAAATAVVMLFTLEGGSAPQPVPTVRTGGEDTLAVGARVYGQQCASCHGATGQGGLGPRLAGTVVASYPDPADQALVVAAGRRSMPAFADDLSAEEIDAVVAFTREGLG